MKFKAAICAMVFPLSYLFSNGNRNTTFSRHPILIDSWHGSGLMWQYVVEEMNILTTVFLGDFNAKVWIPNSVLSTKTIQNFYRSPDMGDCFEFVVSAATPYEKIGLLRDRMCK